MTMCLGVLFSNEITMNMLVQLVLLYVVSLNITISQHCLLYRFYDDISTSEFA
jgi:hypothetical protein